MAYEQRVGDPRLDPRQTRRERALLREVAALALIVLGIIAYVGSGFAESAERGITRLGILAILAGIALGYDRSR